MSELKRRRVFRALVAYGIAAFAVLQIVEPIMHGLRWPEEVLGYVVAGLAIGFPIVVALAWIFDVNAGHIERTAPPAGPRPGWFVPFVVALGVFAAAPGLIYYFGFRSRSTQGTQATSIAVLPLLNLSNDPEQEYFADGLAEELLDRLAKVPGLRVAARTSAFSLKGKNEDIRTIGAKLQVGSLLTGSVQRAGDRVRITTQLINAGDGYNLWSETYDRKVTDVFAVQDDIARSVVTALRLRRLLAQDPSSAGRAAPVPAAHDAYLKGRYHLARNTFEDIQKAIGHFEQAIRVDPAYASAYSGISDSYAALTDYFLPPGETMPRARAAAEKAVQLDESLADAHAALGWVDLIYDWQWKAAEKEFTRAIELNPNLAVAHDALGQFFAASGRPEDSLRESRRAVELDPLSVLFISNQGNNLFMARRYEAAIEQCRKALDLEPNYWLAKMILGLSLAQQGRFAEATAELERAWPLASSPLVLATLAGVYAKSGRMPEAKRALSELLALSRRRYTCPYEVAMVYLELGERSEALDWLRKGYDEHSMCMIWTKTDPRLDPLRAEPRLATLMDGIRFPP